MKSSVLRTLSVVDGVTSWVTDAWLRPPVALLIPRVAASTSYWKCQQQDEFVVADHLIFRESTVKGFQINAYDPSFDSPEALANWRTGRIYSVVRRAAAYWELRERLEDLWEEVTGLPRDSVETNRGGRLVLLQSDGEDHRQ